MSDDLVKRLRSPANVFYEYAADDGAILHEAADRIEKLEAALRKIKDLRHGSEDEDVSIIDNIWIRDDITYRIVCDTLEGKDD